ncbi:potassium transporter TrkA [Halopelagius fulvigenes]|uniref:Potassium transporter TrkA n=1 Tax=Halopelagius fulvigenes TaxID=1198324 RepID=A0ABD5TY90_9EURY
MSALPQLGLEDFGIDAELGLLVGEILGLGLLAMVVSAAIAVVYRWYTKERIPAWITAMFAGSAVAVPRQAVGLFRAATDPAASAAAVFEPTTMAMNVAALGLAVLVAPTGLAIGDRIATDVFAVAGAREIDAEVSRLVRTVGRVRGIQLPESAADIGDIDGYEPVTEDRKEALTGKTLLFPRRLRDGELIERFTERLKTDYGVGHVDVELAKGGTVAYLAVGRRAAGIGPTLAPGTAAVAVRADPGAGASAGDAVQLWRVGDDGTPERAATAELRAAAGDVATVVLDERDAAELDPEESYRILTLPNEPGAEREFGSLLRAADETMESVAVEAGSELDGLTLRDTDATVVAVKPAEGTVEAIPSRSRSLGPGDVLYVVARPEAIRRVSRRAAATAGSAADAPAADD